MLNVKLDIFILELKSWMINKKYLKYFREFKKMSFRKCRNYGFFFVRDFEIKFKWIRVFG